MSSESPDNVAPGCDYPLNASAPKANRDVTQWVDRVTKLLTPDRALMLRYYRGTQVYMASHPDVRACFRGKERPTEFGDKVWDMTLRLMAYLEDKPVKSILEIGCGWGLLGIHLARVHQAAVLCSDVDRKLEPIVLKHAELNGVDLSFSSIGLADLPDEALDVDLIVGSEICYCEELKVELCALVERAKEAGARRFMIADPGRPDFEGLCDFCREKFDTDLIDIRLEGETKPSWILSVQL
tara:strand:+ start:15264 stop:15983 length:720 start_codon:yes stop_codon:yes gene_type:complete